MNFIDIENLEVNIDRNKDIFWNNLDKKNDQIQIRHYRKISSKALGMLNSSSVNSFYVATKKIRKFTAGGSNLMFTSPQMASNCEQMPNILRSVFRLILSGLIILDTLHLWPGEFLPNHLPLMLPSAHIKCDVIEPRWSDNSL